MVDSIAKDKACIFITSTGRTGTQFLGRQLSSMIEDCTSIHEPDILGIPPVEPFRKIRDFGVFRMTIGKLSERNSIRGLNIARHRGKLEDEQIVNSLKRLRSNYINSFKTAVYLEANVQYNALIDLLPLAFPKSKVLYIIRDPRDWICSWMNRKWPIYSMYDSRSWFRNTRLRPCHVKGDPYTEKWKNMPLFEKLCWVWARENSFALESAGKTDRIDVVRYEDLFDERDKYKSFNKMLEFITSFSDGFRAVYKFNPHAVRQKVDSTSGKIFPRWPEWDINYVTLLDRHCRDLMELFNYGGEAEWQKILT